MTRKHGEGRIFVRGKYAWIQYYDSRGNQVREAAKELGKDGKLHNIEIRCDADQRKVERILGERLGEISKGTFRRPSQETYGTLRKRFYANYVSRNRKSLRRDKAGNPHLDKVERLNEFFDDDDYLARDIDADGLQEFITDQRAKGRKDSSINRSLSALRAMFHLARKRKKLTIDDIPTFEMLDEPKPRKGFLEREQFEALFTALPDYVRLPFAVGYFTAMRLGEILSLEWDQIDFLAGTINLHETKNGDPRSAPIVSRLRAMLIEQRAKRQPHCPYICFRLDAKGHAGKIGSFQKVWQSRCVQLGLGKMEPLVDRVTGETKYTKARGPRSKPKQKMTYKGLIFHDTRRSGIRNLVRAGVSQDVARLISGHETPSVFSRYNISSEKDVVEAGRLLEKSLGPIPENAGTPENGDKTGTVLAIN
jgi:integrase